MEYRILPNLNRGEKLCEVHSKTKMDGFVTNFTFWLARLVLKFCILKNTTERITFRVNLTETHNTKIVLKLQQDLLKYHFTC